MNSVARLPELDARSYRRLPSLRRILVVSSIVFLALTVPVLGSKLDDFVAAVARAKPPHLPDLALFTAQTPMLQAHVLAALCAIGLGAAMMLIRKGRRFHRIAGWIWTGLLSTVALSSLFIVGLNGDRWSYLHLGSGFVAVFLPVAVLAARRHRVAPHRALMMLLFYGSLLVSGALAFLPGRLMWNLFFG
jgi:uncharacterized membrane protein